MGTNQQNNRKPSGARRPGLALAVTLIVASLAAGGGARAFQAPPAAPAPGVQAANRPDRMGAISEISGDTYTLTSRRGTVKALILSSVPISGVQGAAASRADLKVGVRIGVFGTAKDDGSMVATRVIVLPAGARPGGPVTPAAPALSPEALAASKALLEKDTPEITVDTTGAPDLAGFASRAKGICEAMYPAIAAYLHTDGVTPPKAFTLTFREMDGVAYTSGDGCHFAAAYFRTHSDDYGAVVHEMTHVIQAYHGNNPGWLVEALDDYVRFYRYEPVSKALHFTSDRVPNDPQAYQIGAQFLNYVQTKYDNTLTPELNTAMRKGAYSDDIWTQKTGKTLAALWAEWKASLPSAAPKAVAAKP